MRVAQQATTLAGHPIPKGARRVLSSFLTNRMPDLYPDADRFKPERWSTINPTVFEYLVFSAGPHACPGYQFGMNVLKVALAAILPRYRVELSSKARIDYRVRPTLRPAGPVAVVLRHQDGAFGARRRSAATSPRWSACRTDDPCERLHPPDRLRLYPSGRRRGHPCACFERCA